MRQKINAFSAESTSSKTFRQKNILHIHITWKSLGRKIVKKSVVKCTGF